MKIIVMILMVSLFSFSLKAEVYRENKRVWVGGDDLKDDAAELAFEYCRKFNENNKENFQIKYSDTWDFRTQAEHEFHRFYLVLNGWTVHKVTYIDLYDLDSGDHLLSTSAEVICGE